MSTGAAWQREWEGGLMLGEIRANERKLLAGLASLCHGKEARAPVFWPGEFHGLYSPWGRKESDTTE